MNILVTGAAGYIGSHTCLELLNDGHNVIAVDDLVNSSRQSLERVEEICGRKLKFYEGDIRDAGLMKTVFAENMIDAVIHFAGLKAVGESVLKPLEYYDNNVGGTFTLLHAMADSGVKSIIFSSSATVYGVPKKVPIKEDAPIGEVTNPYGRTKLMIEKILSDLYVSDGSWNITLLRYFNPIGAHESGKIGECPRGVPNNLTPYIAKVAHGDLSYVKVFGDDYPTRDGTGVRDYIHICDLAHGHVLALKNLSGGGIHIYNLGTGKGYSVLEVIHAFENACGKKIPYKIVDRRPGDVAENYADPSKAFRELGFKAERGLSEMCRDIWNWQTMNPDGYSE